MSDFGWKLRIFFSVDLVGSTAYKVADSRSEAPEWAHIFREFFRDFPTEIESEAAKLAPPYPECKDKLRPWKFSGDEILFWVRLHSYSEVVAHVAAFKNALVAYPERWKQKGLPLKLKATAWVAGFPVTNSEILIDPDGSNVLDFIGPSIDAGFRIAKYSTPRKFVLSADLALMLLDAIHRTEVPWDQFHLLFDGCEPLKGVLDGEPYPLVWLDMRNGEQDLQERLLGIAKPALPHLLRQFLAQFVDQNMVRPFIEGDDPKTYGQVPAKLENKRSKMMELESQVSETGKGHEASPNGEPTIPDPVIDRQGFLPGVP